MGKKSRIHKAMKYRVSRVTRKSDKPTVSTIVREALQEKARRAAHDQLLLSHTAHPHFRAAHHSQEMAEILESIRELVYDDNVVDLSMYSLVSVLESFAEDDLK